MKYTDEQLDEIDRLVAEHVAGFSKVQRHSCFEPAWIEPSSGLAVNAKGIPKYTRSGDAMLALVEKMRADGWHYNIGSQAGGDGHVAEFFTYENDGDTAAHGDTTPLAVALAALAAVGHPYKEQGHA